MASACKIQTTCPYCGQKYRVQESRIGTKVQCKGCQKYFKIQAASPSAMPSSSSPMPPVQVMSPLDGPRQYKILVVKEGFWGSLFAGASQLPTRKMEKMLNEYSRDGFNLNFMIVETYRHLIFWRREAAVLTLSKPLQQ